MFWRCMIPPNDAGRDIFRTNLQQSRRLLDIFLMICWLSKRVIEGYGKRGVSWTMPLLLYISMILGRKDN